jgi:hypothetical protein
MTIGCTTTTTNEKMQIICDKEARDGYGESEQKQKQTSAARGLLVGLAFKNECDE